MTRHGMTLFADHSGPLVWFRKNGNFLLSKGSLSRLGRKTDRPIEAETELRRTVFHTAFFVVWNTALPRQGCTRMRLATEMAPRRVKPPSRPRTTSMHGWQCSSRRRPDHRAGAREYCFVLVSSSASHANRVRGRRVPAGHQRRKS